MDNMLKLVNLALEVGFDPITNGDVREFALLAKKTYGVEVFEGKKIVELMLLVADTAAIIRNNINNETLN